MNYASIIFEINTGEDAGSTRAWGMLSQTLGNKTLAQRTDRATLWVAITSDLRWRELIPASYEEHGFVSVGPMSVADAEISIKNLKGLLESIGLEVVEQTCCDD